MSSEYIGVVVMGVIHASINAQRIPSHFKFNELEWVWTDTKNNQTLSCGAKLQFNVKAYVTLMGMGMERVMDMVMVGVAITMAIVGMAVVLAVTMEMGMEMGMYISDDVCVVQY